MPEALPSVLATPGLGWLLIAIAIAGIVRGFAGFGTALIFVPVAGQFLPAQDVILAMAVTGVVSTLVLVPRAWKSADRAEVGILALAAVIMVPFGIWAMTMMNALTVRWIVCIGATITLVAVMTGWRYTGRLVVGKLAGIGAGAGVLGGMTGLTGPVVIVFYLANARSALSVRSNTILFLAALDYALIAGLLFGGQAHISGVWLGLVLCVPYLITGLIGQALFDPKLEQTYRLVAYCVIALAVITGMPLLD